MRRVFVYIVRLYQKIISPMFPPSCRFYPSCSEYAAQSFSKFGVVKGGAKAIWRILRCHPFNKGGYDPVEEDEPMDHNHNEICKERLS